MTRSGSSISAAIHAEAGAINLASNGQYLAPSGTVGAPSYADTGDRDSGLYFPAANQVGLVAGGVEGIRQTTTEIQPLLPINMQDRVISRANFLDTSIVTQALSGTGNKTIDLTAGNSVTPTALGANTWTFSNPTATNAMSTTFLSLVTGGTGERT